MARVEASIEVRKAAHVKSNLVMLNNYQPREEKTKKRKTYFAIPVMENFGLLLEYLAVLLASVAGFMMFFFVCILSVSFFFLLFLKISILLFPILRQYLPI